MTTITRFTKEQLIERCRGEIECAQITIRNGTSDTPNAVAERLELFEIALAALNGESTGYCEHDGATYYDMSGRERCGMCGSDM